MNVLISGGTGFIGQAIVKHMVDLGHTVIVLTRQSGKQDAANIKYAQWLNGNENPLKNFSNIDVVINLAGDPLNRGRWTTKKKERILTSRIDTTDALLENIQQLPSKPKLLINASAIGIYGYSENEIFTEESPSTDDNFPAHVCLEWEKKALEATKLGVRVVIARFGIVLGQDGGALKQMSLPYRFFIGGPVASGKQWVSWIHKDDVVGLIDHIISDSTLEGVMNFTSPQPVKMDEFGEALGQTMHRPHWLPVPSFLLKVVFGEMSEMLTYGQHVIPLKALNSDYHFKYPDITSALRDLLK